MDLDSGLVVLSLFDGCSCARVALERAGIPVKTYYASEIDKWSIQVTQKNYPDTIQLGDILRSRTWEIEPPDLIIGGSPCQGLSKAGRGKGLKDDRSKLFYEFVWNVVHRRPKWYILENVTSMKADDLIEFNFFMGGAPTQINSALVSAQSRDRYYWTNIPVEQPEDKGIFLKDILENGLVDRDKSYCIDANYWKGTTALHYARHHRRQVVFDSEESMMQFNQVVQAVRSGEPQKIGFIETNRRQNRVYSIEGKSVTLCGEGGGWGAKTGLYFDNGHIRKLTPVECERLQTLPDGYTEGVSNTQRYRMLGNGFTVDVIAHILKGVNNEQLSSTDCR